MGLIYSITNPISKTVIYVGQTINLNQRVLSHLTTGHNRNLTNEIKKILFNGEEPVFNVLETCEKDVLNERERFWIKHFKDQGIVLHNWKTGLAPTKEVTAATLLRLPESLLKDKRLLEKTKYMSLSKYVKSLIDDDLTKK